MYLAHHIDQLVDSPTDLSNMKSQYLENPGSFFYMPNQELTYIADIISHFYEEKVHEAGLDGYVLGLSGGIDSTLVAYLIQRACGAQKLHGLIIPSEHTSTAHIADAHLVAEKLGIICHDYSAAQFTESVMNVWHFVTSVSGEVHEKTLRLGNVHARLRMIVLRDYAKAHNLLVAGTGNASEEMLGYFTLAGDGLGGVDNEGIARLFKTQVYALGGFLDVPKSVMKAVPTAGLFPGQTDEAELGASYEQIDLVLVGYKLGMHELEVAEALAPYDVPLPVITSLYTRCKTNTFKSKLPPSALIKLRE